MLWVGLVVLGLLAALPEQSQGQFKGAKGPRRLPDEGPASIPAPAPAPAAQNVDTSGPIDTVYVITLKGNIGSDFTSRRMKAELDAVAAKKPSLVVIEFDSPGGSTSEAEKIVNMIIERHKDTRIVALVHRALSAAATITLSCKEIYVTRTATIGAAVAYAEGDDGLPKLISEKFQSAWRAVCRKAAEAGGHPGILAAAMVDPTYPIYMRGMGKNAVFAPEPPGTLIKPRGRILTMAAREAITYGVADALVDDLAGLGKQLNARAWKRVDALAVAASQPKDLLGPATVTPVLLYDQAAQSHMFDEDRTTLQRQAAFKAWAKDLRDRRILGGRVTWKLVMLKAEDCSGDLKALKEKRDDLAAQYKSYKQSYDLSRGAAYPLKPMMDKLQGEIQEYDKVIRDIEQCPIEVVAAIPEDLPFFVVARADKSAEAALAKISPEADFTLSGTVEDIEGKTLKNGMMVMIVTLTKCQPVAAPAAPAGAKTPVPAVSSESDAQQKLKLVDSYISVDRYELAKELLRQIIKVYPNTPEARQAQEKLDNIEAGGH
jgi:ATP-dependent protease ClpP protease subunit